MRSALKFLTALAFCFTILFNAYPTYNVFGSEPEKFVPNIQSNTGTLEEMLTPVINQWFEEIKIPGAIIGIYMKGYDDFRTTRGVSDLTTNAPIMIDDKMRIGSITKTFTGTVLLQLVDEGRIALSDKLSKYFPDFPNGDNITIDQVGHMTSGIFNYSEDSTFGAELMADIKRPFTPLELIDIAKKHPPYFPPGTNIHYSNTNFVLLGLIIEQLTGNPLHVEIQNRILNRLGMVNSNFALNTNFPDPHSHGYIYMDSTSTAPRDITNANPSWGWAAGSMISTLRDLEKYAKPLATGELVSKSSQNARLTWSMPFTAHTGAWANVPLHYGFGIADFGGAIGHNGGIPGFNSFLVYIPEKDATIIILANMQDNEAGVGPADDLARRIILKIKGM